MYVFLCSFVKFCFNKNVCYYYLNCFICFGALFMVHPVYYCGVKFGLQPWFRLEEEVELQQQIYRLHMTASFRVSLFVILPRKLSE